VTQAVVRHRAGCAFGAAVAAGLAAGSLGAHAQDATKPQVWPPLPQLNTLRDVSWALEMCWIFNEPPLEQAWPGMHVSVKLAFMRSGALQGEPHVTYVTPEAPAETRALYQRAVVAAINACTPLPFTEALGNALAGLPKAKSFIDRRPKEPRTMSGSRTP
jgi:hypothetical protein